MGPVTKGLKPMSHARIQDFLYLGGGVVQGQLLENSLNNVFFFFLSTYFIVYRGVRLVINVVFFRGNKFSKVSEGVHHLSRGFHNFPGGSSFF